MSPRLSSAAGTSLMALWGSIIMFQISFVSSEPLVISFPEELLALGERLRLGGSALTWVDQVLVFVLGIVAFEVVDWGTARLGALLSSKRIPVRGKHLDDLTTWDYVFIALSKASTGIFAYVFFRYAYLSPHVSKSLTEMTLVNTLGPLIPLFLLFDLFYTPFHWLLHLQAIYGYIHKHHHQQKAPSRANVDAANVHPVEMMGGQWNHLLSLHLLCRSNIFPIHIMSTVLFLTLGAVLAGLNHTRYDICWQVGGITLFDTKAHDVHHRIPQSNYGQYTMFWDYVFGTFRDYDPDDRINPEAQLDPKSGKSLEYMKQHRL